MTVRMAGTVAYMEGDWTITGVADNIASMVHCLNQLESDGAQSFHINCGQVEEADSNGLQLLNVWMFCARLRGIEPKLIDVSDRMLRAIKDLGFSQCFAGSYLDGPGCSAPGN